MRAIDPSRTIWLDLGGEVVACSHPPTIPCLLGVGISEASAAVGAGVQGRLPLGPIMASEGYSDILKTELLTGF